MNFLLNESHEKNKVGVDTNLYTPEKNVNIIVIIQEHKIVCKIDCKNRKNIKQLSDTCPKNKPHQLEKT